MAQYAHITRNTDPDFASGGYKNVFLFCPRADFLSLAPVMAAPAAIGDKLTIDTAHTFTAPKGFKEWACRTHSVTLKASTVGEDGAQELEYTAEFEILGDSASNQEQIQAILNDDVIVLLKEADCVAGQHVQLGNNCVSPTIKVEFDGKTTKEGKKLYKVSVTCKKKYFYTAIVTLAA